MGFNSGFKGLNGRVENSTSLMISSQYPLVLLLKLGWGEVESWGEKKYGRRKMDVMSMWQRKEVENYG